MNRACFPKEKHQNSQKWAKFMNFSFWPFLWFGLPGRLLSVGAASKKRPENHKIEVKLRPTLCRPLKHSMIPKCTLVEKPLTSTLLTSTLVLSRGGVCFGGFELERSFVATSLEGVSVTGHEEERVAVAPFKEIERVRGASPGTKNQSGHVQSGL